MNDAIVTFDFTRCHRTVIAEAGVVSQEVDVDAGHFYEAGMSAAFGKVAEVFFTQEGMGQGFRNFIEMTHAGGVTTIADMGTGLIADVKTEATQIGAAGRASRKQAAR